MTQEAPVPIPEDQVQEYSSHRVKGIGATVLTIGAATFANYGISFVLDYADRRVDDPAVAVPLLGSMMLMAVGKRMMDFADKSRMLGKNVTFVSARELDLPVETVQDGEFDPTLSESRLPYGVTGFNDGSVIDLRPAHRNPDPQDPQGR